MSTTSINIGEFGVNQGRCDRAVLTARPDMRIIKFTFLVPALLLAAGTILYLLPLQIDRDLQIVGSILVTTLGLAGLSGLLVLYEALTSAIYTLTDEHIEEEYGIIKKRVRRIPLSYVRDVTYDQNFLQAVFGVSSVTVSPTNGHKTVLSNVPDGERMRDVIWNLVLSKSPR